MFCLGCGHYGPEADCPNRCRLTFDRESCTTVKTGEGNVIFMQPRLAAIHTLPGLARFSDVFPR
jgi:hypothetical protein